MQRNILAAVACLPLLFLLGCNQAERSTAQATVLNTPSVKVLSRKPGLPVSLVAPRQALEPGVPTQVDVSLLTPVKNGQFEVQITPSSGLTVTAGLLSQQPQLSNGKLPITLQLRADTPGEHFLTLDVVNRAQTEGLNRRALTLVLMAGSPPAVKALTTPQKEASKSHHVLPAQERVQP
jgi:hypothetical protein